MSHVLAVLSSVFPDGEDYFVRSVEAVRDRIDDPKLRAEVDGFSGQEYMHGREHRALNERLAELGYPTRAIGIYVRTLTGLRERFQGKKANLGYTVALEHYTATLAEKLLGDPAAAQNSDTRACATSCSGTRSRRRSTRPSRSTSTATSAGVSGSAWPPCG